MNEPALTPFRPRRALVVSVVSAVALVGFLSFFAVHIQQGGVTGWNEQATIGMIVFAVLAALCVLRFGLVKAVPTREALVVHNLVRRRRVEWAEVVGLQFGGGAPWLVIDLSDTEQLTVMAIQHADGRRAEQEAIRLARLVEHFSRIDRND